MDYIKQWSWSTLLLYIILAVLIAYLFRKAIDSKKTNIKIGKFSINKKYIYYLSIYIIFILFSVFRLITEGIGGADMGNYINYFETLEYVEFDLKETIQFSGFEWLFFNLMVLVRTLHGNFLIFSWIIYSIIIICYIYVIDKTVKDEEKWYWLILAFLPLLKSFNIVRNCLAAAIGFIAMESLNKNKYITAILWTMVAFFNHYIAIILLGFIIFYKVIPDKLIESKKILIILNLIVLVLTFVAMPIVKEILGNTGFLGYLTKIEVSIFGYIPIIVAYLFLLFDKNLVDYMKQINHLHYYKMMIFISFVLPVFILLNGASRVLLFFELPRYILYGDMYFYYRRKVPTKYIKICDVVAVVLIIAYFVFRIWRIWDGYALMPYYNTLFM